MKTIDPLAELDEALGTIDMGGKVAVVIKLKRWYIVATHTVIVKGREIVMLSIVCTDESVNVPELVFSAQRGGSQPVMTTNDTTDGASVWVFLFKRKPTKTNAITIRRVVNST